MVMPLGNEDPSRILPWVTFGLMLGNLLGFVVELIQPLSFTVAYAVTPYEITNGIDIYKPFAYQVEPPAEPDSARSDRREGVLIHQAPGPHPIWLTLFTALFLHADLAHLAGNLLFLFVFGQKVEEALGRPGYLLFYLVCGIVGTITQVWTMPNSLTPTLGASGAIAGVMGAFLLWFPRDRIRLLVLNVLVLVPSYAVIGIWILFQLIQSYLPSRVDESSAHIAYLAHLGGAATGLGLSWLISLVRGWRTRLDLS